MLSVPIGNLTCVGVSAELQVCYLGLHLAYLCGWITGYSHTCIKLSALGNGLLSDYSGWHLWKWCWKNKISIPRQIGIKPFLLLIVPKNIMIKNNNTDYERLLNAIHTQYTVYLLLENAIPLVKMTRTLNRLWQLITGQFYIREMIFQTLVSVCLIDGDRLIQVWLYYVYGICLTDSILPYVRSVTVTTTPTLVDHI